MTTPTVNIPNKPMDMTQLKAVINQELSQSLGSFSNDATTQYRIDALNAYLGGKTGDEQEGRSQVTTTDVADVIEWIMPEMMKAFTQARDSIQFDAMFEGDEEQAELETAFVYDILMKQNDGFVILYQMIKDALMQKNGIIKIDIKHDDKQTVQDIQGINSDAMAALMQDINTDIMQATNYKSEDGQEMYDVKVIRHSTTKRIEVKPIAPESFRVNRHHNCINLKDARFTAEVDMVTRGDLIAAGYDKNQVMTIPSIYDLQSTNRNYRFWLQQENTVTEDPADRSQQLIQVATCYIMVDLEGNGIPELKKIIAAGGDGACEILHIDDADENPFIATTAILMSHKFLGLSIYDRIKQIQDTKTALLRNQLDNIYFQNNQQLVVAKGQVEIDDLLVRRPGGIIRANNTEAVKPLVTPDSGNAIYQMIQYQDQMRSERVGAGPDAQIDPTQVGDRVGSEGITKLMNAKEELIGLMIRLVAETGIKPACIRIRDLAIANYDIVMPYKFKGQWKDIQPSSWQPRSFCTVTVGTGAGNRAESRGALQTFMQTQAQILQDPRNVLVKPAQIYNLLNDFAKTFGMNGAHKYFIDPNSDEGRQFAQQVQQGQQEQQQKADAAQKQQLDAVTTTANAEMMKAENMQKELDSKHTIESLRTAMQKMEKDHQAELESLRQQHEVLKTRINAADLDANRQLEYDKLNANNATKLTVAAMGAKQDAEEAAQKEQEAESVMEGEDNG